MTVYDHELLLNLNMTIKSIVNVLFLICHSVQPVHIFLARDASTNARYVRLIQISSTLRVCVYLLITTTTTTVLWPSVRDYPGELVPKETFTHSHLSWSSTSFISFLHLLWSI